MSNKADSEEIPVNVISNDPTPDNPTPDNPKPDDKPEIDSSTEERSFETRNEELSRLLDLEKLKSSEYEEKLKLALADFQNLVRKTQSDIENGINAKINGFILDFLEIYDDFLRAKQVFSESDINSQGLDSILKNMDSLLKKYHIEPIDALGEIFDPNFHEAIAVTSDPQLDDSTITKEIRKGYISHKAVIRHTLVEISKKDDDKI